MHILTTILQTVNQSNCHIPIFLRHPVSEEIADHRKNTSLSNCFLEYMCAWGGKGKGVAQKILLEEELYCSSSLSHQDEYLTSFAI